MIGILTTISLVVVIGVSNPAILTGEDSDLKHLYDDLLGNYNRLIRPVANDSEVLTVKLGIKLAQLVEVNLRNQIVTTNLWVEQMWYDYRLVWEPEEYGGLMEVLVPSEHIWLPDIVLFNNADGNYEVTLMTMATVHSTGLVIWKPPALYKSSCKINIQYFPFDEQSCHLKFGSWTYDGFQVDLQHIDQQPGSNIVPVGINLKEYYLSAEWDILAVPAARNEEYYPCCDAPYLDVTFTLTMRRKTLFYTVNLVVPCVGISYLTILLFYLPSDSGEKISLCINILLSLTVFFLLMAEIIPPTSVAVPLIGKYLMFTMILVTLSIFLTVAVLNIHWRSPSTHKISPWVRRVFIHVLPRLLLMQRPMAHKKKEKNGKDRKKGGGPGCNGKDYPPEPYMDNIHGGGMEYDSSYGTGTYKMGAGHDEMLGGNGGQGSDFNCRQGGGPSRHQITYSPEVLKAIEGVQFIAQRLKDEDKELNENEEWKYVAMVLDRMFLWIFTLACAGGTFGIIFQAPALYDDREPIDYIMSDVKFGPAFKHEF